MFDELSGVATIYLVSVYTDMRRSIAQLLHGDGKTPESKSYIWLYTSGAFEKHRIVIYEYQPTRGGYHAAKFLADYHGYVHTDGFSGYNLLKDVTRCGCRAHLRRYMSVNIVFPIPIIFGFLHLFFETESQHLHSTLPNPY